MEKKTAEMQLLSLTAAASSSNTPTIDTEIQPGVWLGFCKLPFTWPHRVKLNMNSTERRAERIMGEISADRKMTTDARFDVKPCYYGKSYL